MRKQTLVILISVMMLGSGIAFLGGIAHITNETSGVPFHNTMNTHNRTGLAWNEFASPCMETISSFQSTVNGAYSVQEIRQGYNLTGFYKNNICGQGFTIAIIDAYGDPSILYDINSFDALYALPSAHISFYYPFGAPKSTNSNTSASWSLETATDVEWFHAIAPRAHIDLVVLPTAAVGYLQGGVNDTVKNISGVNEISMSWGIPETKLSQGLVSAYNKAFEEASKLGISAFAASGDQGAYDGTKTLTVNYPASSPNLTAVGGTTLRFINGQYNQTAWDNSGGGYSQYFAEPSYQANAGIASSTRGMPDISAIANPNAGGVYVLSRGKPETIGGTSLATPITAGTFMLIDQYINGTLKNVDNKIYKLLNTDQYGKAIVPITSGYNGHYHSQYGWNPVTGLGTYNGMLLAQAFSRMEGFYGYRTSYGTVTHSDFHIETQISLNSTFSLPSSYEQKVGIFAGTGSSSLFAGIYQKEGNLYVEFQAGNYLFQSYFSSGTAKNISVSLFVNGTSISFNLGNYHKVVNFIPQTIYGSNAGLYAAVSSGTGIPTAIRGGSLSHTVFYQGSSSTSIAQSGSILAPFNSPSLATVHIMNLSSGFSYFIAKNSKSGDFGSFNVSPIIELSTRKGGQLIILNAVSSTITANDIPLTNNTYRVTPNQTVKISVTKNSITYNFEVVVPDYNLTMLRVEYPASSYYMANFNSTVDHTFFTTIRNETQIMTIGSDTNVSMKLYGFAPTITSFSNSNPVIHATENPVNLSIQISPINTNISFSAGKILSDLNGSVIYSVIPQNLTFNFSMSGSAYIPFTGNLSLIPGVNQTYIPIALEGRNNGYFLNGTVYNEIYHTSYDSYVPIPGAEISSGITQSYSDIFGSFSIWLPSGKNTIKTGAVNFYNATENYSSTRDVKSYQIFLNPNVSDLLINQPTVTIDRVIPFMFVSLFISWSTNFSNRGVTNFVIYYKADGAGNWSKDVVSGSGDNIAFINGIYPGKTYEFMISAQISGGTTINSNVVTASYSSPVVLILTVLLYLAIGFALYSLYSFSKNRKKKKAMKRQFEEWEK